MFNKILIANRGEIAVRVIRACREMSIRSVVVYSEADRKSLHVRHADEAYWIGAAPSRESYLNIGRVVDSAKRAGADAIHPGYGFLAENPAFAHACRDAGLTFIGPTPETMELMGSKTAARHALIQAGLPVVPGTDTNLESFDEVQRLADEVGFPVMLKAAAGGGGKGLRVVPSAGELESAYRNARSEAQNAFNDPSVYIEKYIERPRHIEIQLLGDHYGNLIYLGERECSLQRRHQKVVEECPSPFVNDDLRRRMGETAVRIGKLAGYSNAGTAEFLVDRDRNFYFLEMNTRLQVEHPVTEMAVGIDLVQEQIRLAAGQRLLWRQEDVQLRGSAVECRICAEDPEQGFFPSPGSITRLATPSGPGVRDDSGVYQGWQVPLEYDSLLAKLIVWGSNRAHAIARMRRALGEYEIVGPKTNLQFLRHLVTHPEVVAGDIDTGFIDRKLNELLSKNASDADLSRAAMVALALELEQQKAANSGEANVRQSTSAWKTAGRDELLNSWPRRR